MDAVVSLCLFCEGHGPRILFTTQVFRESDLDPSLAVLCSSDPTAESPDSGNYESRMRVREEEDSSRSLQFDVDERSDATSDAATRQQPTYYGSYAALQQYVNEQLELDSEERCGACTSSGNAYPSFLINDDAARMSYVGSQWPYRQHVYDMVKQACLRSLSSEQAPEQKGVVFFGDEEGGYCISCAFEVRDSAARGFRHLYSIVIVSSDRLLLLNPLHYDFLVRSCKSVIDDLQSASNLVFEQEQSNASLRIDNAQRAALLPQGWLRERAGSGSDKARPLAVLTNNPHVFADIHKKFFWMLRAQTQSCIEYPGVLEGRATQDMQVCLEELELDDDEDDDQADGQPRMFFFQSSWESGRVCGAPLLFEQPLQPFTHLQLMAQRLSRPQLQALLGALVVGKQVVIRSACRDAVRHTIEALSCLLPRGCVKIVYFAHEYFPSYVCNLLGVDAEVSLSDDVNCLLITVECPDNRYLGLSKCIFNAEHCCERQDAELKLKQRYLQLLTDGSISPIVLASLIKRTREEWLNKSKLYYQHRMQHGFALAADPKTKILFTIAKCTAKDMSVLNFWQSGLSKQYKSYVRAVAKQKSCK